MGVRDIVEGAKDAAEPGRRGAARELSGALSSLSLSLLSSSSSSVSVPSAVAGARMWLERPAMDRFASASAAELRAVAAALMADVEWLARVRETVRDGGMPNLSNDASGLSNGDPLVEDELDLSNEGVGRSKSETPTLGGGVGGWGDVRSLPAVRCVIVRSRVNPSRPGAVMVGPS